MTLQGVCGKHFWLSSTPGYGSEEWRLDVEVAMELTRKTPQQEASEKW